MRRTGNDHGAARFVTVTWLFVLLAIVGIAAFDGISVMSARVSAENDAQTAAYAASAEWHTTRNVDEAYQAAVQSLLGKNQTISTKQFTVDPDGTVHLVVLAKVHTLVMYRIPQLRQYSIAVEHGDANSIN
jgi:Flp pilus assembly protein TadG